MEIRYGIIGCGGIAKFHLEGCKASGLKVVAVADINPEAAAKFAEEAGGAKVFNSADALLESGLVDAVSICSTPNAHEGPAVKALKLGIHVLLEKPMANTVESAKRIGEAAEKSKAKLMLAYRHRLLPAIQEIKRRAVAGELGRPVLFHNTFCGPAFYMKDRWFSKKAIAGGGSLMDTSSHSIDLFRYLVGEPVESAALFARHLEGTDVEDVSAILLKTADGALGSLTASWVAGDGIAYVELVGENGRIKYDYCLHELTLKLKDADKVKIEVPQSNGFAEEIAEFRKSIESGSAPVIGASDGLRGLEIIQNAYGKASA